MITPSLLFIICALLAAQLLWDHRRVSRALADLRSADREDRPAGLPALSIVRPTKGADVEQLDNFRASLRVDYPGDVETIFVFEDAEDPAHDLAMQAISEHRARGGHGQARIVLAGAPPPERTGKINNMIIGADASSGEIVAFGDSDTRPSPDLFRRLVTDLVARDDAGAIFAFPVTTPTPRTAGDVGYAVILNAYLGAEMQAFAGQARTLPFLMGQTMVFRRKALDAIGGVQCAEGQLVDDMFLGAQVAKAGFGNLLGRAPVSVINHGLSFGDFYRLWRRWLFFGRGGIPLRFVVPMAWRGFSVFMAIGLMCAAPAAALPLPLALLLAEGWHYLRLNRLVGGARIPARFLWMAWLPQPMAAWIAVSMFFNPTVEWRGRTYRLDLAARLRNG